MQGLNNIRFHSQTEHSNGFIVETGAVVHNEGETAAGKERGSRATKSHASTCCTHKGRK